MSEKENSLGVGLWKIEFLYFLWIDFSFSCFFIKHRYSMNFHNHLVWFHSLTKIFKRKNRRWHFQFLCAFSLWYIIFSHFYRIYSIVTLNLIYKLCLLVFLSSITVTLMYFSYFNFHNIDFPYIPCVCFHFLHRWSIIWYISNSCGWKLLKLSQFMYFDMSLMEINFILESCIQLIIHVIP